MKKNKKNGFTLIEMMITVAIVGIMALTLPGIMTNITRFFRLNTARIETQRAARDCLSQINQSLRQALASSIYISQETSQPPISSIYFTTSDSRSMKFYQSNKSLFYVLNGSTSTLATGLRYISFSYPRTDDATILSVSVTFEKDTYQGGTKALQMAIEKVRIMN